MLNYLRFVYSYPNKIDILKNMNIYSILNLLIYKVILFFRLIK